MTAPPSATAMAARGGEAWNLHAGEPPAARRNPAASYITTNEKIRAIANGAEDTPAYLPTAVVMPITIAAWLLGMPPVSARTRRFSLRCRTEVRMTLAAWAIAQATSGARRYFTCSRY